MKSRRSDGDSAVAMGLGSVIELDFAHVMRPIRTALLPRKCGHPHLLGLHED